MSEKSLAMNPCGLFVPGGGRSGPFPGPSQSLGMEKFKAPRVKSFNYMTERLSVGSYKNMTKSASGFPPMVMCSVSAGVAPERRSKTDATDWLRSGRQPSWVFFPERAFSSRSLW